MRRVGLDVQNQTRPFGGSDHVSFQHQKVPALHFFTGVHEDYHRPSDTADKINSDAAVRVLNLMEALIEKLWVDPQPLEFMLDSLSVEGSNQSFHGEGGGAYLGVMPDYASMQGRDGCEVSSVMPGSPAQKAGLQGGDVIVQWNDQPVDNVYDLSRLLHRGKPGDEVTLKVRRHDDNGEEDTDVRRAASDLPNSDERGSSPQADSDGMIRLQVTLGQRRRPM